MLLLMFSPPFSGIRTSQKRMKQSFATPPKNVRNKRPRTSIGSSAARSAFRDSTFVLLSFCFQKACLEQLLVFPRRNITGDSVSVLIASASVQLFSRSLGHSNRFDLMTIVATTTTTTMMMIFLMVLATVCRHSVGLPTDWRQFC